MSQATDYVLSNQSGAAFRAELNTILAAIVSANSGASEPTTMYAFMPWADTSSGLLKIRNAANDNWVTVGTLADVGLGLLSRAGGAMTGLLTTAKGADVASATTLPLINDGNYFDVTGTTTITAFASLGVGTWIGLHFDDILTLTHSADLVLPTGANITTAAGDEAIFVEYASGDWRCVSYTRASGQLVGGTPVTPNYITGLTLSTAGASTTITIAAGVAADSTNAVMMTLASAINKTTASWAVGDAQGGLDTGTIANNTWYHFYEIRNPTTVDVDIIFSTNASTPTLPSGYTQYRRIMSWRTDASGQWESWYQVKDTVYFKTPNASASNITLGTSKALVTVMAPLGMKTEAILQLFMSDSAARQVRLYSDDDTDAAVSDANCSGETGSSSTRSFLTKNVLTNTSSQVAWRADASTTDLSLQTLGFIYPRTV